MIQRDKPVLLEESVARQVLAQTIGGLVCSVAFFE